MIFYCHKRYEIKIYLCTNETDRDYHAGAWRSDIFCQMKQEIEVKRRENSPSRIVVGDVIHSLDNYLPEGKQVIVVTDSNVHHHRYKEIHQPL